MEVRVPVIIVTHNSGDVLPFCLKSLFDQQGCTADVTIVDSGSADTGYLLDLQKEYGFALTERENIGFSRANNIGWESIDRSSDAVVFCNPDTILSQDYLSTALHILDEHQEAGIIAGTLLGFEIHNGNPTGRYDSTGVFRTWYGRWYDRDQGEPVAQEKRGPENLPAACGALLVCRRRAIESVGPFVFDPDFFLYKEDIELSLRLRKRGWALIYRPELQAYHCRGWNRDRQSVARELREHAAESEVTLYRKHPSPYIFWALAKLAAVRLFGV